MFCILITTHSTPTLTATYPGYTVLSVNGLLYVGGLDGREIISIYCSIQSVSHPPQPPTTPIE